MTATINKIVTRDEGWKLIDVDGDRFITANNSIEVMVSSTEPSPINVGHRIKTYDDYLYKHFTGENLYVRGNAKIVISEGVYRSQSDAQYYLTGGLAYQEFMSELYEIYGDDLSTIPNLYAEITQAMPVP